MMQATPAIYGKLLLTAFFWGGSWIAGRVAVQEASPFAVASWRFFIAALALGILLVQREGRPRWTLVQWGWMTALGLAGIFLYNIFFLYGLRLIEAGRGALVVALTPAVIALADAFFFGTRMSWRRACGVGVALFGCLLVVTDGNPALLFAGGIGRGEWLIFGSVVTWTAFTFIGRRGGESLSPLALTFGGCLTGWAMLTVAALVEGSLFDFAATTWRGYWSIVFLGLLVTAAGFTWYSEAIATLGATRSAAFINLVPMFAVLLGAWLLGERLAAGALAGGLCVIAGVWLTNRYR